MDWSDRAEHYLAEHYGETIYDPRPEPEEETPPRCHCGARHWPEPHPYAVWGVCPERIRASSLASHLALGCPDHVCAWCGRQRPREEGR